MMEDTQAIIMDAQKWANKSGTIRNEVYSIRYVISRF